VHLAQVHNDQAGNMESLYISKRQPKNDPLRQLNFDPPVI